MSLARPGRVGAPLKLGDCLAPEPRTLCGVSMHPRPQTRSPAAPHQRQRACRTKLKSRVQLADGSWGERIPAWTKWATQEWNEILFNGVFYEPEQKGEPGVYEEGKEYVFKYPRPQRPRSLRVYECHVGMSSEEPKVNTYLEFRDEMIPRIRKLGYNCIQIMAIQVRHPLIPSGRCACAAGTCSGSVGRALH